MKRITISFGLILFAVRVPQLISSLTNANILLHFTLFDKNNKPLKHLWQFFCVNSSHPLIINYSYFPPLFYWGETQIFRKTVPGGMSDYPLSAG